MSDETEDSGALKKTLLATDKSGEVQIYLIRKPGKSLNDGFWIGLDLDGSIIELVRQNDVSTGSFQDFMTSIISSSLPTHESIEQYIANHEPTGSDVFCAIPSKPTGNIHSEQESAFIEECKKFAKKWIENIEQMNSLSSEPIAIIKTEDEAVGRILIRSSPHFPQNDNDGYTSELMFQNKSAADATEKKCLDIIEKISLNNFSVVEARKDKTNSNMGALVYSLLPLDQQIAEIKSLIKDMDGVEIVEDIPTKQPASIAPNPVGKNIYRHLFERTSPEKCVHNNTLYQRLVGRGADGNEKER